VAHGAALLARRKATPQIDRYRPDRIDALAPIVGEGGVGAQRTDETEGRSGRRVTHAHGGRTRRQLTSAMLGGKEAVARDKVRNALEARVAQGQHRVHGREPHPDDQN